MQHFFPLSLLPSRSAFTLLEMLLALAIIAVLAGSLFAGLHIGFTAREHAEEALAPVRAAELALEFLAADVQCAPPPDGVLAGAFTGVDDRDGAQGRDADSMTCFSRAAQSLDAAPGIVAIEYRLLSDNYSKEMRLVRRCNMNLLSPETVTPPEEEVCSRVLSFNVRYFDGTAWYDTWDSTAKENALPATVEVTLEIADPANADTGSFRMRRLIALPCAVVAPQTATDGAANDT